jgi:hypothetical protein
LKGALKDAYAVYAVTNYWETRSADVEMKQGKAMADAAKEAGVQHFVWSSLPNVTERKYRFELLWTLLTSSSV